jgi:hypothetical protein
MFTYIGVLINIGSFGIISIVNFSRTKAKKLAMIKLYTFSCVQKKYIIDS